MRLPQIKPVHDPTRLRENRIRIGTIHYGVASELQDDENGNIWQILTLMDGTRTMESIASEMIKFTPDLDEESVYQVIQTLIEAGFVEDAGASLPEEFTKEEVDRYSRSAKYFAWIDTQPRSSPYEVQLRLKQAKVTILGLGGSGSAIAMSLVSTGIGNVHCIDFDLVEGSNLNRQLLYKESDIGLPKVECAVKHLRQLNSYVSVTGQEFLYRTLKSKRKGGK